VASHGQSVDGVDDLDDTGRLMELPFSSPDRTFPFVFVPDSHKLRSPTNFVLKKGGKV
jgi:hypothetical protein